ncbi:MAG TPA: DUF6167 family protein [Nocardioides sp.]|nr:DUF6167 family protein [Nocardioides sp.]
MRRGFWFAAGAATGVYGMVRARRVVEVFTPDGMRDRVGAAFVGARIFREELAQGMTAAETELRQRYEMTATERHRELEQGHDTPGLDTPSPSGSGYSTNLEGYSTTERDTQQ